MTTFVKNSHCSYCGNLFEEQTKWPRQCHVCLNMSYINPLPAAVVLLNVRDDDGRYGTLVQKRNINPMKGHWALTGGYMDKGETWQESACREIYEELGIESTPNEFSLLDVGVNTDKSVLIIFGVCLRTFTMEDIHFSPNEEVSDIQIIYEPMELAFPTHTEILKIWFGK